ncbi:diacylglycerol kinase family protein [Lapillicoccus sp.]|uniref:diacylglycerol kinase family protein n=1 Tax=Lapillicoccus sp. TaxID=1909287 RepID=UPI0025FD77AF|nr:diacylglycerol kinase family protein [Lapillicoccus sp.]
MPKPPDGARRRVGLIVNPTAGKGQGAVLGERTRRRLVGTGQEVLDLSGRDLAEARAQAREAVEAGAVDVLAVVGGDGLAHLGVNLCAGTDVPLLIVAAGSGNDNARSLGLPVRDPEAAVDLLVDGQIRAIDAGRTTAGVDGGTDRDQSVRWWLGVLGGGFDSIVTERAHRLRWPRGPSRYTLAVALELPRFRAIPYAVTVDDVRIETEAMLVAVANGPAFGGGMLVCPDASYDDGLLDVLILHKVSTRRFLRIYPQVFRGRHVAQPEVQVLRGRRVRLEAAGIMTQADGERFEPLPLDVEVVQGALRVVCPRKTLPPG